MNVVNLRSDVADLDSLPRKTEHNPVVLAKQVASLDKLSGGRFDFGVGIGWLAEEFAAVGVPWERRAERTREYLKAMKRLWTEEEPEFKGEFCSFPRVCSYPKPLQKPHPPINLWWRERAGTQAGG